jgi:isopenicillin-N epimerase
MLTGNPTGVQFIPDSPIPVEARLMDRRTFLTRSALYGAGAVAVPALTSGLTFEPPAAASEWASVRSLFLTDPKVSNLAGFFLASHPKPVRDAIEAHRRGLDDCPFTYLEERMGEFEKALRSAIVSYFGGAPDDYAMTGSTTMGLATVYCGLKLRSGDEILTTEHDHYSTWRSLEFAAERTGAPVRTIPLYRDIAKVTEEEIVETLVKSVRPRTRIVAVTWVHSSTGLKLPVAKMARALAQINAKRDAQDAALLCVDGVHGFGVESTTISELGCDFFMAGCHKWILGPRGTGLIYAKPQAWAITRPTIPTFDGIWRSQRDERSMPSAQMTPGGFHAFEHAWALTAAFQLHLQIGKASIAARIHTLNRTIKEELARMPHVKLYTPLSDALSAGIVCFDVKGMTPAQVVKRVRAQGVIASETPYAVPYARLAASLLNNEQDVERAIKSVAALA